MKQMVRKQIYLQKRQEELLKKWAEMLGVSESEVIRRALDSELSSAGFRFAYDREAWKRLQASMLKLNKLPPVPQKKRDWKREDLYEDRMKRYDRS